VARRGAPPPGRVDRAPRLLAASASVVDRLERDLEGTGLAVIITDEHARVLDRRCTDGDVCRRLDAAMLSPGRTAGLETSGTTALEIALRNRVPALVVGAEHSTAALKTLATAAAPIVDQTTGQLFGAITLAWAADATGALVLFVARQSAREIEGRLVDGRSVREHRLREAFLHARRRARGPLLLVDNTVLMRNARAARLFDDADRPSLWDTARRAADSGATTARFATRSGVPFLGTVTPLREDGTIIAVIVQGVSAHASASRARPARIGTEALSDTEHAIAEFVAEGLTNREIGARLYMSHHTVDSHLRSAFRKLDITSRSALAALVTSLEAVRPTADGVNGSP
jgi:DNA-binding CsgD family transcriptional regulator